MILIYGQYGLGTSTVARGWSGYLTSAAKGVGITIPSWLYSIEFNVLSVPFELDFLAAISVVLVTMFLLYGMKESALGNAVITFVCSSGPA